MPIHITRIRVVDDRYQVIYNGIWEFLQDYDQIKDTAWNFNDIKDRLSFFERRKKISRIMKIEKKIYNNGVIFQKNDY